MRGWCQLIVEGLDKIIIMDVRDYPGRSVEEPEKEKTLRGAQGWIHRKSDGKRGNDPPQAAQQQPDFKGV